MRRITVAGGGGSGVGVGAGSTTTAASGAPSVLAPLQPTQAMTPHSAKKSSALATIVVSLLPGNLVMEGPCPTESLP